MQVVGIREDQAFLDVLDTWSESVTVFFKYDRQGIVVESAAGIKDCRRRGPINEFSPVDRVLVGGGEVCCCFCGEVVMNEFGVSKKAIIICDY